MFDDDDQFAMLNSPQEKRLAMLEAEAQDERREQMEAKAAEQKRIAETWREVSDYPTEEGAFPLLSSSPQPMDMSFDEENERPVSSVLDQWRKAMAASHDSVAKQMAEELRAQAKRHFHTLNYGISVPQIGGVSIPFPHRGMSLADVAKAIFQTERAPSSIDAEVADTLVGLRRDADQQISQIADAVMSVGWDPEKVMPTRQTLIMKGRQMGVSARMSGFKFDPFAILDEET